MKIFAYSYTEPLLETIPESAIWGWEVERIYQDIGERQQLQQLIEECQLQAPDYLLIRRVEELGDSVEEACDRLSKLESFGIHVIPLESNIDDRNGIGAAISKMTRLQALKFFRQLQEKYRSRSIRKAHARNRIKAAPPPGKAPYGYRRGKDCYTLDRSAAPVVKDFFDNFLLYGSLRGAVRHIDKKYGKKISVTTGRRWLSNSAYRGDLEYLDGETISNTHTAIVSREQAAQVDRLLGRNKELPPRTASAPRSLAGLVVCSECQSRGLVAKVTVYRKDREYLYVRLNSCRRKPKCKALNYQEVLEKTIEAICRDLPSAVAEFQESSPDGVKGEIKEAIASKQETIAQLDGLIADGTLDTETAEIRAYKLRTEIAELEGKLAKLPPVNLLETVKAISLPEFWWDLSESERRFYFREFISQIEILRDGNRWSLRVEFIF